MMGDINLNTTKETSSSTLKEPHSKRLIVVMGERRSGTTVFRSLLTSAGANSLGEIFHKDEIHLSTNYFNFLLTKISSNRSLIHPSRQVKVFKDYLDFISTSISSQTILMDIKYPAMTLIGARVYGTPDLVSILQSRKAAFLLISRRNKLRCYVSEQIALRNGKWHGERSLRNPVLINPHDALAYVSQSDERTEKVKGWLHRSQLHILHYEEMFTENFFSAKATGVASALMKKDIHPFSPSMEKQNPESLNELVVNFGKLEKIFESTPYEWMLHA